MTGGISVEAEAFVIRLVADPPPTPVTRPLLVPTLTVHTGPANPATVNVQVACGGIPAADQAYRVPDATEVTTAAPAPAGWSATACTNHGGSVSVTVRFVIVVKPVFVTT